MTNLAKRLVSFLSGLFFIFLFTSASYYTVQTVPNIRLEQGDQYVNDPQNILTPEAVERMNSLLWDLEEKKTIESAVVVLPGINEEDPDDFATDLFNYWGIGKVEDNNGLLILLLTNPEERCIIFRTGTGLQKYLTDAKCYRIQQDDMIPHMASGDYSTGLVKGVESVVKHIEASKYKPATPGSGVKYGKESAITETTGHPFLSLDIAITGIILFIFLIYWMSTISYQCPACRKKKLRLISSRREIEPTYTTTGLKVAIYRCTHCGHEKRDEAVIPIRRMARQSSYYSSPRHHHHTTVIHTSRPRSSGSGSSWSGSSRSTSSSSSRSSYSGGRSSGSGSSYSSRSTSGGGAKSSFGSSSRSSNSSSSSGRSYGGGRSSGGGSRSSTGGSKSRF